LVRYEQSWLWTPRPRHRPALRLICFPHAGGSARFFRPWTDDLPDSVELAAVRYPGRDERDGEPVPGHLDALAQPTAKALAEPGDVPLALFGHGMGAVLAFETARLLTAGHVPSPRALFVSGHPAPTESRSPEPWRGDDEPVTALRRLTGADGIPPDTVYADLRLARSYRYRPGPPLACPVTALLGRHDTHVGARQADAWRACTTGPFTLRAMPGDHFYLVPRRAELIAFLLTSLGGVKAVPPGATPRPPAPHRSRRPHR